MQFILLSLIATVDATQLKKLPLVGGLDNLKPEDVQGLANPVTEIHADITNKVNSLVGGIMAKVQPILENTNLTKINVSDLPQLELEAAIKIDVSPIFDISVNSDMDGSFHGNGNAFSTEGDVTRVNGGMVIADFHNALHDNNDAIGKGNVERLNGVAIDATDETTYDMLNGAVNSIGAMSGVLAASNSSLSLRQKLRTPVSLSQTQSASHSSVTGSSQSKGEEHVGRDSANAFLSIQVNPAINIDVTANMTGAFYDNNNAKSEKGSVQRVNGAMAVADFSGALYNNNMAMSTDGDVQRINGASMSL